MGDCKCVIPMCDGEHHMIAAAQDIVKALGSSNNLTDELRKLLVDLDIHLSTMAIVAETSTQQFSEVEARLMHTETKIANVSTEVEDYLQAVDEILYLTENIGSLSLSEPGKQSALIHRARAVLQVVMERLEEELVHILSSKKKSFECENTSKDLLRDESHVSTDDENISGDICDANMYEVDLVHPIAIPDLKSIASRMFASNYDQEFCEAFIRVRKDALDEYLLILEIEELSIEDIMKLESSIFDLKIKTWSRVMKILVQVYLRREKWLCKQIMGNFGSVHEICFIEISTASVMRFLNFGQAVALGPHEPDQLFHLLNMYEVLSNLVVDIETLFSIESGFFVRTEFHELVKRLVDSVKATFQKFENAVALKTSINPFPGGGVHPLTKYVMNYLTLVIDYGNTLTLLFQDQDGTESSFARHLQSVTSILESNLVSKSTLYRNDSLQDVFLMNNIHYMVQKVKNSDLRTFLGDEWIITHIGKMQQLARSYERKAWTYVLSLLKDDVGSSLNYFTQSIVKQRFKRFNLAFKDIYKSQIGWCVPDPQLRSDLQISISTKLILAYRGFTSRNSRFVKEKNIKYTVDDLEVRLLDLFEGTATKLTESRV